MIIILRSPWRVIEAQLCRGKANTLVFNDQLARMDDSMMMVMGPDLLFDDQNTC